MIYPKRVIWKEAPSGHSQPPPRNPQRERVEASLRLVDGREEQWDERTRTVRSVRSS
ncbi:MAG: hypothetical protein M3141_00315 [Actinomycetota bacterium]|nr:hypothetical protein [Actinomycetota bacterium]